MEVGLVIKESEYDKRVAPDRIECDYYLEENEGSIHAFLRDHVEAEKNEKD